MTSTLRLFLNDNTAIPPSTAWYLSDLGEFRGKQELYTRQSPQRLKALREHALIESAVSSNRIEGVLKSAYREFVERVGETAEPRGSKTQMVLEAIAKMPGTFSLADLERACPGVSRDMIRRVLNAQKGQSVDCIGRGPGALWQRRGN